GEGGERWAMGGSSKSTRCAGVAKILRYCCKWFLQNELLVWNGLGFGKGGRVLSVGTTGALSENAVGKDDTPSGPPSHGGSAGLGAVHPCQARVFPTPCRATGPAPSNRERGGQQSAGDRGKPGPSSPPL